MTNSTVFGVPYLSQAQATPEASHNVALYMVEAMLRGVKAIQNAPPGAPADGDTYIVGTAGSGAWLGKNNCVAIYASNAWRFVPGFNTAGAQIAMGAAHEGMRLYNQADDTIYTWTGAAWSSAVLIGNGTLALAKLVNAGAQFDIIGRKTAAGGAWEDCTRSQLELAVTNSAGNTLLGPQIINAGSGFLPTTAGFVLRSDDAGANGPFFTSFHNSASPAANDTIFGFLLYANNSTPTQSIFASWQVTALNVTAGAMASQHGFFTYVAGAQAVRFVIKNGIYTANATGGDQGADTVNAGSYYANGNLSIDTNALLRTRPYTVGTLPAAAGITGAKARVTDSLAAPVFAAAAVGGGTVYAPVESDGTTWRYF